MAQKPKVHPKYHAKPSLAHSQDYSPQKVRLIKNRFMLLFGKSLDYALVAVKASTIRTNTSTFKKIEAVLKNKAMQSFADYIAGNKTVEQHGHFMNRLMQTFVTTMRFAGAQTEDVKKFETSIKKRFNELKSNSLKELIEQTQQSATLSDKPLKKTDFPKNNQN